MMSHYAYFYFTVASSLRLKRVQHLWFAIT